MAVGLGQGWGVVGWSLNRAQTPNSAVKPVGSACIAQIGIWGEVFIP